MSDAVTPRAGDDRIVIVGKIVGTFGVQGWVKVRSHTDPPGNILDYRVWQLARAGAWSPIEVADGRVTQKGVMVRLAGIDSPEAARTYIGAELGVHRSELPPPEPGEYYWSDLEGLNVLGPKGEALGIVDHFRETPAGDVVIVRGEREHWIPFVKERILQVDLDAKRIVLDWDPGWSE